MRRRTHPTAIQADRDTRSCHVPRRSRWGTVRWRGFECFVPSPPPRAPAISRTSDAPLLLDRRGWLLWAGSRGRVSCWPAIVATTAFFLSHCPHHQTQSHFSRRGGRATSSLRSTNKSPVTSSHFPTTSCQNLWLSPRFPSILVHQELGASWWLRRADGAATRGPLPCPVGCLRNLTPPPPPRRGVAPGGMPRCWLGSVVSRIQANLFLQQQNSIGEGTIAAPSQTGRGGAVGWPRTASSSACRCVEWLALSSVRGCRSRARESRMVELRPEAR